MDLLLAPHGTRGDVQPMIALGLAARARGHAVRFLAPDNFVPWIAGCGFACEPDGIDIEATLRSPDADLGSPRWQWSHLRRVMAPRLFASLARVSEGADLIVAAGVQLAAPSIAEWRGIPSISVAFCPCAVPNGHLPPPSIRSHRLPRVINRLLWSGGKGLIRATLGGPIARERARLGLRPPRDLMRALSGDATIVAADPDLGPMPAGLPPRVRATPAWILDSAAAGAKDASVAVRVERFLASGPPPVYVGFGSMVTRRERDLPGDVAHALRLAGVRAIVAGGWASIDRALADSDAVLAVPYIDHAAVLPRVAVVVHHGGAGTTTAAARGGVPQVILPHILDQYYWAHRVEALGLGPRSLPVREVTKERLAQRIRSAVRDERYRANARALAPRVAARNGASEAVQMIEQGVAGRG